MIKRLIDREPDTSKAIDFHNVEAEIVEDVVFG